MIDYNCWLPKHILKSSHITTFQGGDFVTHTGAGGESIYGKKGFKEHQPNLFGQIMATIHRRLAT